MVNKVKTKESSPDEYEKFIAQLELEDIRLDSLYYQRQNREYEFKELEDYTICWQVSYDKYTKGFRVFVDIIFEALGYGKDGGHQPFDLEVCFNIWYHSNLEFSEEKYEAFGKSIILPLIWPYFREAARDIFSKAGIHQITDIPLRWRSSNVAQVSDY